MISITGEGPHRIETRARDLNGNVSAWRPQTIRIDSVQPARRLEPADGWTKTNTFTLKGTDATSGMASEEYLLDNAVSPVTIANNTAMPALGDGLHTITHRAVDVAGQASDWVTDWSRSTPSCPRTRAPPRRPPGSRASRSR